MKLIKQPNIWSCGIASLAMLLDESINSLIVEIGHDGSEIILPKLKEPERRRGFSMQEFYDCCYNRDYSLMEITCNEISWNGSDEATVKEIKFPESRLIAYMANNKGLIVGRYNPITGHMCAWDGEQVFDPKGRTYRFNTSEEAITIDSFYLLNQIRK